MKSLKPSANLFGTTFQKNLPLTCTFELTKRCNLRCKHCYIDEISANSNPPVSPFSKGGKKGDFSSYDEMTTSQIKDILLQLKKTGVLFLVFTGGEIFLRKDILELCETARKLGFDLRLFTNATLLSENIADKLATLGLSCVEISLYGKKQRHEQVTEAEGSYEKTMKAINMLLKRKIPVTLKAPLMSINFQDRFWLIKLAEKLGTKLKQDPIISPTNRGDKHTLKYRLNEEQMKSLYIKSEGNGGTDLICSAGKNFVCVSSDGTVYPCLQLMIPLGDLKKQSLKDIFSSKNEVLTKFRSIKLKDLKKCSSCCLLSFCSRCPGLALLEEGDLLAPSRTACGIARILKHNAMINQ
jgi:AdoMet-dependent heme synthase